MMNIAISAVLGMMIGLFVVFLIEYLDNKLKTTQDIENYLDWLPLVKMMIFFLHIPKISTVFMYFMQELVFKTVFYKCANSS